MSQQWLKSRKNRNKLSIKKAGFKKKQTYTGNDGDILSGKYSIYQSKRRF